MKRILIITNYLIDFIFPISKENKLDLVNLKSKLNHNFKFKKINKKYNIYSIFNYENKEIKKIVKLNKYFKNKEARNICSNYFEQILKENFKNKNKYIITNTPQSSKRKRERGFNQTKFICKKINLPKNITYTPDVLIKIKHTETQTRLNKKDRIENLKNTFSVSNKIKNIDFKIIVIDDVYTTGTTSLEIIRSLKKFGFKDKDIFIITFAWVSLNKK